MVSGILIAMAVVGAVGLFIGLFLGIAGIKFKVEVDEREEAVLSALPGNNCGGCGYAGCANLAAAIAKGEAPVNACPVGGEPVGKEIAKIMGVEAGKETKKVAFVACQGTCDKAKTDYEYHGIADCAMLSFVPNGGPKSCDYGCTGFGNCVKACPFDAIHVVDGVAVVDKEACKAEAPDFAGSLRCKVSGGMQLQGKRSCDDEGVQRRLYRLYTLSKKLPGWRSESDGLPRKD